MMEINKVKSIAIILDSLGIGGIEKACLVFVEQLLPSCKVTLIMGRQSGDFLNYVPKGVNVKVIGRPRFRYCFVHSFKKSGLLKSFTSFISYILAILFNRWVITNSLLYKTSGFLDDEFYDCAVAFHGMKISDISKTLYSVKSKVKMAYIHGDHPFLGRNKKDAKDCYNKFDYILCDSNICKNKFIEDFDSTKNKIKIVRPMINKEEIISLSKMDMCNNEFDDCISILTVGRLSKEKGQDLILCVVPLLRKLNIHFKWFLIGDGSESDRLKKLVQNNNLKEILFLGSIVNPYPYIKRCDIYVQPSYSEAYSISVAEAATLGKPIILTDVCGIKDSFNDGLNCLICEPNVESIYNSVSKLLLNKKIRNSLSKNVLMLQLDNHNDINIFKDLIYE